jgi:hypothetical protein
VREAEFRIEIEYRCQTLRRIGAITQISGQRVVERLHGCGRCGRYLKAVGILEHPTLPRARLPRQHAAKSVAMADQAGESDTVPTP